MLSLVVHWGDVARALAVITTAMLVQTVSSGPVGR
jgi:hypothetical protein